MTDLLSTDAVKVKPGADGRRSIDGAATGTLAGRVQRVEPAGFMKISALGVEEQRVNVVIDFVDPRERRASLGDGFRVEVRIVVWEKADAITVPTSSLFRIGGRVGGLRRRRRTSCTAAPSRSASATTRWPRCWRAWRPATASSPIPGESLTDGARVSQKSEVKRQK